MSGTDKPAIGVETATTTVRRLTPLNVRALDEHRDEAGVVSLGATTATFSGSADDALERLQRLVDRLGNTHGRRGHPVASLHAVVRKIAAQTGD